jgi:hypothetical protein
MFAWLATAAIFNMFYRPSRRGRKVAYLTLVGFGFLVLSLAMFLLVDSQHGAGGGSQASSAQIASPAAEGRS